MPWLFSESKPQTREQHSREIKLPACCWKQAGKKTFFKKGEGCLRWPFLVHVARATQVKVALSRLWVTLLPVMLWGNTCDSHQPARARASLGLVGAFATVPLWSATAGISPWVLGRYNRALTHKCPCLGQGLMAWQWQLLLLAREPLFSGGAPGVLICPIFLPNPVISCRTGCLVEGGGVGWEVQPPQQMSSDCILSPRVIVKTSGLLESPETLASEAQHCTGGHSLPCMTEIHLLPVQQWQSRNVLGGGRIYLIDLWEWPRHLPLNVAGLFPEILVKTAYNSLPWQPLWGLIHFGRKQRAYDRGPFIEIFPFFWEPERPLKAAERRAGTRWSSAGDCPGARQIKQRKALETQSRPVWKSQLGQLPSFCCFFSWHLYFFFPLLNLLAELPGTGLQPAILCIRYKVLFTPSETVLPEGTSGQWGEWGSLGT